MSFESSEIVSMGRRDRVLLKPASSRPHYVKHVEAGEWEIHPIPGRHAHRWTNEDFEALWRTIYGEACGKSYATKLAIGFVVLNRVTWSGLSRYDYSIESVCLSLGFFACWKPESSVRPRMMVVDGADREAVLSMRAASDTLCGLVRDPTMGADSYHPESQYPAMGHIANAVARIGGLWFYVVR